MMESCSPKPRRIPKTKKTEETEEEFELRKKFAIDNPVIKNGFSQIRLIEWIKTNPQPRNSNINYLTNAREVAITAVKGVKPTFNSVYDNGIYEFPLHAGKDRFHPTQKSLKLFEELVKKHSNPGDLVLDPFLGSGTTAMASKRLGRNFIGCEIDKEFFQKTLDRLE